MEAYFQLLVDSSSIMVESYQGRNPHGFSYLQIIQTAFKNEIFGMIIHCTIETQRLGKESSAIFIVPTSAGSSCLAHYGGPGRLC